ncbi:sugar phosphate isomerase/epimerase [Thermogutta sp.]|uniref:sugar phosphate isomerase/epimerase family protein n=1 Tax=Thermogutta sp. TaxID=1962930 RepID=UPI0032206329
MDHRPLLHRREFLHQSGGALAAFVGAAVAGGQTALGFATVDPEKKKPSFRLALASYTLRKFPLPQALEMTKRVGLKHICLKSFHLPLDASPEQINEAKKLLADAGIDLYAGGVITMTNEQEVVQAFDYAKRAGMRLIVASPRPPLLPLVERKVQETSIAVAIHNHGPGDKFFPTPESVYEHVKGLDPRVGLCMDVGHTARIGADPVADARRFANRLLDVHIKDIDVASPTGKCVECGRGVLDLPGFLRTLIDTGYGGMVSFEFEKDENDPLPGLAESVGYVRGVLDALLGIQDRSIQLG